MKKLKTNDFWEWSHESGLKTIIQIVSVKKKLGKIIKTNELHQKEGKIDKDLSLFDQEYFVGNWKHLKYYNTPLYKTLKGLS